MPIDDEYLMRLRRYQSPGSGLAEEFLEAGLGSTGALGVLARPLDGARDTAWVVCPSLGSEEAHLRRLEGLVARELAARGFPVLRIRRALREDQDAPLQDVSLAARLDEVEHAVSWLLDNAGVRRVGLLGALFGGTVAALAGERLSSGLVGLWEPVTRGRQYLREALRFRMISGLLQSSEEARPERGPDPRDELAERGFTLVRGLRLTQAAYDEIEAVDLAKDVQRFRGRALLVAVSSDGEPSKGFTRLAAHFEQVGAEVAVDVLEDPLHVPFGEHYYRNVGIVRIDTRIDVDRKIAAATAAWAASSVSEPIAQPAP